MHQKAGSTNVLELHGSIVKIKCTTCDYNEEIITEFLENPPLCKCGSILRPDVVWFGESLPQDVWQEAIIRANQCDLMIIAGTSFVVSPANTLPIYKQNSNVNRINPENTGMSSEMDLVKETLVQMHYQNLFHYSKIYENMPLMFESDESPGLKTDEVTVPYSSCSTIMSIK